MSKSGIIILLMDFWVGDFSVQHTALRSLPRQLQRGLNYFGSVPSEQICLRAQASMLSAWQVVI